MEMIFCTECGAKVPKAKFCAECGAVLGGTGIKTAEQPMKNAPGGPLSGTGLLGMGMNSGRKPAAEKIASARPNTSVSDQGLTMLVDYCRKTVATVGGDGYSETVLYRRGDNEYEIHVYAKYVYMEKETHYAYRTKEALLKKLMKYLEEAKVEARENAKGISPCGGITVVKFLKEGKVHRITSENLGPDEMNLLEPVGRILQEAILPQNELK